MKVNPFLAPLLVIVTLLGSVLSAQALGLWSTSGRTAVNLQQMSPADIKGWMTLQQVMDGLGLSQTELYALANVPPEVPTSTALKDLEKIVPGFETSMLREVLDNKFNTPEDATQPTPTPTPLQLK